jgi:hypothetical protein
MRIHWRPSSSYVAAVVRRLMGIALIAPIVAIPAGACLAALQSPPATRRIGADQMQSLISIRATPDGRLVVLDLRGKILTLVCLSTDGKILATIPLPADLDPPGVAPYSFVALGDREGNYYLFHPGDHQYWKLAPNVDAKAIDIGTTAASVAIGAVGGEEYLYVLGNDRTVFRLHLPDLAKTMIALSGAAEGGGLSDLHVRQDGDLYAYSQEMLIWHFSADGKLLSKIGGAGPKPPQIALAGGFTDSNFDVTPGGDVFWTAGDYGSLIEITADGKRGMRFSGAQTAPMFQMAGLALSGDDAYVVGGTIMTAIPLIVMQPGTPGTSEVDPRVYGYAYSVTSPTPYKLFTGADAHLALSLQGGNRTVHHLRFSWTLYDIDQTQVSQGEVPIDATGLAPATLPLPVIQLPRLGWYRLDNAMKLSDGTVLLQRTNLLTRTDIYPELPIPTREVSGWNDMLTHKMIGMGLHRFATNQLKDITTLGPMVDDAIRLKIPYFFQLTNRADVTPAHVDFILASNPHIPMLEIMNEPDQQGVSPEDYVEKYLKPCYAEAHRLNPAIKILGPAKCGIELGWMERFFKAGGGKYVDIVSVHSYERNNSIDAYHWNWKLAKLKEMMAIYGCGDKPLYQTEHGFSGNFHNFIDRPQLQARNAMMETLCMDRAGVTPDDFYYYYVNEGGFADCSTELVDVNRELNPAALMMRTRAHLLQNTHYAAPIDLGSPGNLLVQANRFEGSDHDVLVMMNNGVFKPVSLAETLPAGARIFDCFGNPVTFPVGAGALAVGMYPMYVVVPHGSSFDGARVDGASVDVRMPWSGTNIAPQASFVCDDPQAQPNVSRLTNGLLEFDFHDEPLRQGMYASYGRLPVDLTAQWPTPRKIDHVILYGTMADNQYCTPLDYRIEARVNGVWQTVDQVHVPTEGRLLAGSTIQRITSYANPWIFEHDFAPINADAIRFHFTDTTFGQYPTEALTNDLRKNYGWGPIPQALQLREIQVFSTSGS